MGLRPANFHEKPSVHADWADGGADPLGRAGRPRPAAGPTISASCRAPAGRRGRRPRTRGSAPPFPEGGFSPPSIRTQLGRLPVCAKIDAWGPAQRNPDRGFSAPTNSSPALRGAPPGAQFLQPCNRISRRSYTHEHYSGTGPSGFTDSQGAATVPTRAGSHRTRCEGGVAILYARLSTGGEERRGLNRRGRG